MTTEYIIALVCLTLSLDKDKLISETKTRQYSDGRFIAMTLIRNNVKVPINHNDYRMKEELPYKTIAYIFQRKNHVTVYHAICQCEIQKKIDKKFKRKYDMVVNLLDCNLSIC